ncbi:MAG: hypothetical protein FWF10_07410 [Clostridiales bacterium]|nr:hypothetical protein [Clostridiales bacterium]
MWKRVFASLFAMLCLLLLLPIAARADPIIVPTDDFYNRHRDECKYVNRDYYADGADGFVSLRKEPGSDLITETIENGTELRIQFTYEHEGELWGIIDPYRTGWWFAGWVPMAQLSLVYDSIAFAEEHGDEFHAYTSSYTIFDDLEDVILWTYPGSGKIHSRMPASRFAAGSRFEIAYTDAEGRTWGCIGYWIGDKKPWVCIDAPTDEKLPALLPATPVVEPTPGNAAGNDITLWLIAGMVLLLTTGTAVLIWALGKHRKRKQKDSE